MESEQLRLTPQERRLLWQHDQDLYRGNGKPGLTTRVAVMEDIVTKISRNLAKIVWLLVAGCITALAALVVDIALRFK